MANFMSDIVLKFLKQEGKEIPKPRQYKTPSKPSRFANHILRAKRKVLLLNW